MASDIPQPDEPEDSGRIALSALLLDTADKPRGPIPEDGELWDWIHGKLSNERRLEIDEHIARDAQVYERWRQLRLCIDEPVEALRPDELLLKDSAAPITHAAETPEKTSLWHLIFAPANWRWSGRPVMIGATVATLLTISSIIAFLPSPTAPPIDFWQDWRYEKSSSGRPLEPKTRQALNTVLAGIRSILIEHGISPTNPDGAPLPLSTTSPQCLQVSNCDSLTENLYALGKSIALARLDCLHDTFDFSNRVEPAPQQLAAIESEPAAILRKPVRNWVLAESGAAHCGAVVQTINRTLLALQ